jgi:hypothetical protein
MSIENDGGPAFPSHGSMGEVIQEGQSLRDYFAAKAMQSILLLPNAIYDKDVARFAYEKADEMIEARKL